MKVVYFVMKYPTLSQTFIEREMLAIAALGLEVEVHPCWDFRSAGPVAQPLPAGITVVRPGSMWRVLGAALAGSLRESARRPSLIWRGVRLFARHFPRHAEGWFMTVWGALFALARAGEMRRRNVDVFHGAWATAPATVAAILGELCDRPFSFGAHAYDLYRHGGDPFLGPKLRAARFVHTTTQANVDYLQTHFPGGTARIVLSRRGLPVLPPRRAARVPGPSDEFRVLSVGRLVDKKGHVHQLAACAELVRRGRNVRLRIIGDGPLRELLQKRVAAYALDARVEFTGEQTPAQVDDSYAWADAFWHTGVIDSRGDRDGLPNVIPEAMARSLPVISSLGGGAAEAVMNDETGLVVDPSDSVALANAVERLADDAELRRRLGECGREWVEEHFLSAKNARHLAAAFEEAAGC